MSEQQEPQRVAPAPGAPGPDTGRPPNQPAAAPAAVAGPAGQQAAGQARAAGQEQQGPQHPAGPTEASAQRIQQLRPGAVPAAEAAKQVVLPPQHPHSGTIGPATTGVAGTEAAKQQPTLQRIGGIGAAGETQPGTPPPGEPERAADPEMMDKLRETSPADGAKHKPTAVRTDGGGVVIRQRLEDAEQGKPAKQRAMFVNPAFIETVEDDGETVRITTASGKTVELDEDEARVARPHLFPGG